MLLLIGLSIRKRLFREKKELKKILINFIEKEFEEKVFLEINTLDRKGAGINGCYLSVTGKSADAGDSGEVGRGNRVDGLIPLIG